MDAAGVFTIGPVTIHADAPLFGTWGPFVSVQTTTDQLGAMCVSVDQPTCAAEVAQQRAALLP